MRSAPRLARWMMPLLMAAALSGCGSSAGQETQPREQNVSATRLAVIGDFGTRDAGQQAIADAIKKDHAKSRLHGLVTTGDNVYPSGEPEDFDEAWTEPYGWVDQAGISVFASLGNHDDNSGPAATKELMSLLRMPGRWYAEQVGNVQVIVLDANDVDNAEQQQFLERTLDAPLPAGIVWRLVAFHQPAYSCSRHGSTRDVQREWVPLFEQADVDLILNGHDHVYQRFEPIGGVTYVVSGAAGSSLYEMAECPAGTPEPAAAAERAHYVVLETTQTQLRIEAFTADRRELDSHVISK